MRKLNQVKILAVETSCDDTCVAILKIKNQKSPPKAGPPLAEKIKNGGFDVLSSIVSSQVKLHSKYGGVYPTLAKREHQRNLVPVLKQALLEAKLLKLKSKNEKLKTTTKNSKLKKILEREEILYKQLEKFLEKHGKPDIDLIVITVGPGLEPCLWVGINFAKSLAYFWNLPIVPTNHVEAHIIANWLTPISSKSKIKNPRPRRVRLWRKKSKIQNVFPAVCLVVSGGHTQLILMRGFGKYKIIGETRDDAAGECFDKAARILGIGYPGGPAIAAEAAKLKTINHKLKTRLPRPMMYQNNYDFSFSGLKTAVLYDFKTRAPKIQKSKEYIRKICHETQQAIIDVLIYKTLKAAKDFKAKTIILGGGVTANDELRKQFASAISSQMPDAGFLVPPKNLCTDNAAMIGIVGYYHWLRKEAKNWEKIGADANLRLN